MAAGCLWLGLFVRLRNGYGAFNSFQLFLFLGKILEIKLSPPREQNARPLLEYKYFRKNQVQHIA